MGGGDCVICQLGPCSARSYHLCLKGKGELGNATSGLDNPTQPGLPFAHQGQVQPFTKLLPGTPPHSRFL